MVHHPNGGGPEVVVLWDQYKNVRLWNGPWCKLCGALRFAVSQMDMC